MTAMLLDLGALDSVDYFANGELCCVIATEDTYKEPLKALLWSNGFHEDVTEIASYTGCSKLDSAKVLGGFLHEKAPHVHLLIHRDRDYMSEERATRFEHDLNQINVIPFLTHFSDIEGFFLNSEHLSHLNPGITPQRAQELVEQATNETRDKSIEAMINIRTSEAFQQKREGGVEPNHGQISLSAIEDYDGNPEKWRRGKIVIGRVIALIQQEAGANPRVYSPSQYLVVNTLRDSANQIWPNPN